VASMALGLDLKQPEDSPDGQSHNLAMSHQWEPEGDILNPVTQAMSRSQPHFCPRDGIDRNDSVGNAAETFTAPHRHTNVRYTSPS